MTAAPKGRRIAIAASLFATVIGALGFWAGGRLSSRHRANEDPPPSPAPTVIVIPETKHRGNYESVDLSMMLRLYEANEVETDRTYQNSNVSFLGAVGDIEKDDAGQIFVIVTPDKPSGKLELRCMLAPAAVARLGGLKKGDNKSFAGWVWGRLGSVVSVRDCSFSF